MPIYERGGTTVGGFKVGRWMCLRQDVLLPGERFRPRMDGFVRLGALREQLVQPTNLKIYCTVAPLRWFEPNIVDMIKDPNSVLQFTAGSAGTANWDSAGLGRVGNEAIPRFFQRNWNANYNWHQKWPEDAERSIDASPANNTERFYGLSAVNLESGPSRIMDADGALATDYEFETTASGSREKFDVRDVAQFMGKLRNIQDRDWRATDRYHELLRDVYNAAGDRGENEQIPMVIDEFEADLAAEEVWATDSGNLGSVAGVLQANINNTMNYEFAAPEHMIISYWMCIRLIPIWDEQHSPWMNNNSWIWAEVVGDPDQLAVTPPQQRQARYFVGSGSGNVGVQPAGHMWRTGWNSVHSQLRVRDSYMFFQEVPSSASQFRTHGDLAHAFQSQSIGDGLFSVNISQPINSRIGLPMASVMAGTG